MKRLFILLLGIICCVSVFAETKHIYGTMVSTKVDNQWCNSTLTSCDLWFTINENSVIINTLNPQIYYVIGEVNRFNNEDGKNLMFDFLDSQYRRGRILFLLRPDKNCELYIQYNDCIIVYLVDL